MLTSDFPVQALILIDLFLKTRSILTSKSTHENTVSLNLLKVIERAEWTCCLVAQNRVYFIFQQVSPLVSSMGLMSKELLEQQSSAKGEGFLANRKVRLLLLDDSHTH